jgi:hypothetical protein
MKQHSVSITSDSATLKNGRSYVAVTAHYISDDWVLRDVVLGVDASDESHTGEVVSDLLDQVLHHWEINSRVFAAVTDNGSNFVKAVRINSNIQEQLRCGVHTLQLSLKDAASNNQVMRRHDTISNCQFIYSQFIYTHIVCHLTLTLYDFYIFV